MKKPAGKILRITPDTIGRVAIRNRSIPEFHLILGVDRREYKFLDLSDVRVRAKVLNALMISPDFQLSRVRINRNVPIGRADLQKADYDLFLDSTNYRNIKWQ